MNQRYLLLPELQPLEKFWQGPCDNAPTREQNELPGWALGLHVNNFSCSVCRFLKHPQVQGELTCFLHFGVGGFRENKCCGRKSMSKKVEFLVSFLEGFFFSLIACNSSFSSLSSSSLPQSFFIKKRNGTLILGTHPSECSCQEV